MNASPGLAETCFDLLDNDCDGLLDEECDGTARLASLRGGGGCTGGWVSSKTVSRLSMKTYPTIFILRILSPTAIFSATF